MSRRLSWIRLRIGDRASDRSDGSFAVEPGQPCTGQQRLDQSTRRRTRWMELFLRGSGAWELSERPSVGTTIQVSYTTKLSKLKIPDQEDIL